MEKKKPFYKKTWFKVVIGLFLLGTILSILDPKEKEETEKAEVTEQETEKTEEITEENTELTTENMADFISVNATYIQTMAQHFVEEKEMKSLKGLAPSTGWKVANYKKEPVTDADGNEYPISFIVSGRYEEKDNGQLNDFQMILGYKNEQDVEDQTSTLLQYINFTNGNEFTNISEEDNIMNFVE